MNSLAPGEVLAILLVDGALAACAIFAVGMLYRRHRPGMALTLGASVASPLVFGLWSLSEALSRDDEFSCGAWAFFCYSAYGEHWLGWVFGWLLAMPLLLGLGLAMAVAGFRARTCGRPAVELP